MRLRLSRVLVLLGASAVWSCGARSPIDERLSRWPSAGGSPGIGGFAIGGTGGIVGGGGLPSGGFSPAGGGGIAIGGLSPAGGWTADGGFGPAGGTPWGGSGGWVFTGGVGAPGGSINVGGWIGIGGSGGLGSCCVEHQSAMCDNPRTTACVCAYQPACCQGFWGPECVKMAMGCGESCGAGGGSNCTCDYCTDELTACAYDAGCLAIAQCVASSGCSGLGCLTSCRDTIDLFGGVQGESFIHALSLVDCALTQGCSCN